MSQAAYVILSDEPGQPLVIRDVGPWTHRKTVTNDADRTVARLWDNKKLVPGRRLFYFDSEGVLDELQIVGTGRFYGFKALSNTERARYLRLVPTRQIGQQAREYAERARNGTNARYGSTYQQRLVSAWLSGYKGETSRNSTNFDAPLRDAHQDGRAMAQHEIARLAVTG